MSDPTRNRKFAGKSAQKRGSDSRSKGSKSFGDPNAPRRSKGVRQHQQIAEPRKPNRTRKPESGQQALHRPISGDNWIWGVHAVKAAISNPRRSLHRILITDRHVEDEDISPSRLKAEVVNSRVLDDAFGASHQGMAVQAAPLEWPSVNQMMADAPDDALLLVLDQITDPHNVGAMFRLASAFGVSAIVMQTRHAPPLSGATAKVAVGCLETVPVCLVTNIANTLGDFQKANWLVTGLAGETDLDLSRAVSGGGRQVIVMGAEGPGLRPRVRDYCDQLARIPMRSDSVIGEAESLNVATAAAIALYEVRRR
jgi:23S rRNA (guanosine2251-2'-O)-methyltransferase